MAKTAVDEQQDALLCFSNNDHMISVLSQCLSNILITEIPFNYLQATCSAQFVYVTDFLVYVSCLCKTGI